MMKLMLLLSAFFFFYNLGLALLDRLSVKIAISHIQNDIENMKLTVFWFVTQLLAVIQSQQCSKSKKLAFNILEYNEGLRKEMNILIVLSKRKQQTFQQK